MPNSNHIADSGKDEPTSQISRPGSQQNRTGPWRRQVPDGVLDASVWAAEVTAVTEAASGLIKNGERVMSRPTARFANLRSKFPEDPAEHHAAMRLGSFQQATALAPTPSATESPQGSRCLGRVRNVASAYVEGFP